jgi:hypothetical protein
MPTNLLIITVCITLANAFSQSDMLQTGIRSLPPGRDFSNLNNLAVLRYAGAPQKNPIVDPTVDIPVSQIPLVETDLHVCVSY